MADDPTTPEKQVDTIEVGRAKPVHIESAEVKRKFGELGIAVIKDHDPVWCMDRDVAKLLLDSLETALIKSQRRCLSWAKQAVQARGDRRFSLAESLERAVSEEEKQQQGFAVVADSINKEKCPVGGPS